jgi:hypothetical protein
MQAFASSALSWPPSETKYSHSSTELQVIQQMQGNKTVQTWVMQNFYIREGGFKPELMQN